MNKKGNINQLFPAVLAIILIGALICVGMIILSGVQDVTYVTSASTAVINETLTTVGDGVTAAGETVAGGAFRSAICTIGIVTNSSSGTVITAGNRTVSNCLLTSSGTGAFNNTNWNVSYSYVYQNATTATNALGTVNTSIAALATTWLPIIIVVLAAGIVLAILLGAFGGKRK